jgi:hypothetical protein
MSDAGIIAAIAALGVPIVGAAAGALFGSFTRRRDEKDRRTGERIGKLESESDYQRGYTAGVEAGLRQGREEAKRNGDPR